MKRRFNSVQRILSFALTLMMLMSTGIDTAVLVALAESAGAAETAAIDGIVVEAPQEMKALAPSEGPEPVETEEPDETPSPKKVSEPVEREEPAVTPPPTKEPEPTGTEKAVETPLPTGTPTPAEAEESTPTPETTESVPETPVFTSGYAVVEKRTKVYSGNTTSSEPVGVVRSNNAVVYVTERFGTGESENDWLHIAFYAMGEDSVATGYVRAKYAIPLTQEQSAVYVQEHENSGDVVFHLGRGDRPLKAIDFERSQKPVEKDEPTAMPASEETAAPEDTEAPLETAEPEISPESDVTPEPADTVSPMDTISPEETEASHEGLETPAPEEPTDHTLMDAATGIAVTFSSGVLPEGILPGNVSLRVTPVSAAALESLRGQIPSGTAGKLVAYDITLVDSMTGEEIEPTGPVGVSMPVPKDFAGELSVYHLGQGDAERLSAEEEGGRALFETDSFSIFVLYAEGQEEPTTTNITARVEWIYDAEDAVLASSVRQSMTMRLRRNGVHQSYFSLSPTASVHTFYNLPIADGNGNPYAYEVGIYAISDYPTWTSSLAQNADGVWVLTQTFQKTIRVEAAIRWSDQDNRLGLRPELTAETVTIQYKSGNATYIGPISASSLIQNEDGSYSAVFEDVPTTFLYPSGTSYGRASGDYTIIATNLPGHYTTATNRNSTTGVYTQTNTLPIHSVTVNNTVSSSLASGGTSAASWNRAEALGIEVPDSVTVTLMMGNQPVDYPAGASFTLRRNEDGSWPGTTADTRYIWYLPRLDANGTVIDYSSLRLQYTPSKAEGELPGQYMQAYTPNPGSTTSNFTLATTLPAIRQVTVPVTWADNNNALGLRPADVTLTLLANGEPVPDAEELALRTTNGTANAPAGWQYLPKLDEGGQPIHYSVRVNGLPAHYEAAFTENPAFDDTAGYGVGSSIAVAENLTLTMKTQKVIADVLWESDGSDNELNNRPLSVNLTVLASRDGGATYDTFEGKELYAVTRAGDGSYHIQWDLPVVDAQGNELSYKVVQNPLSIYSTSYADPVTTTDADGNKETKLVVTNTYSDAWNYAIDLSWDTPDPTKRYDQENVTVDTATIELKYQLTISANDDYEPGMMEIRIPRALWEMRSGTGLVPGGSQISLPLAPATNPQYAFHYYIDTKGTTNTNDDEIVFVNWAPIESGFKQTLTAGYSIIPYNAIDCTVGALTATGSAQSTTQTQPETQTSNTITYRLDTGVRLTTFTKAAIGGEQGRLYAWNTTYGPEPEDFDPTSYNYVSYRLSVAGNANQQYRWEIEERPDSGGEVVSIHTSSSAFKMTYDEEKAVWNTGAVSSFNNQLIYYYVVVAYPRVEPEEDPLNPGQTYDIYYRNDVTLTAIGADEHEGDKGPDDQNDISIRTADVTTLWRDYEFTYTGALQETSKTMSGFDTAGVTRLEYGVDASAYTTFRMTVNGYNLEHGFSFEAIDNSVYAYATIDGERTPALPGAVRLGPEDYEFASKAYVQLSSSNIDRMTGATIIGQVPGEPFTLWGQKEKDGVWTRIMDIPMTSASSTSYEVPPSLIDGQGYNGLRLTSPEGLQGQFIGNVYAYIKVKASSPLMRGWLASGDVTSITVDNIAGHKVYAPGEAGGAYQWINPSSSSSNTRSRDVGLDAEDFAREGAYLHRKNASSSMNKVSESAGHRKSVLSTMNDTVNSKADIEFGLYAYEYISTNVLPDAFYMEKSADEGVFYDLLPLGYSYNPTKGVKVAGAYSGSEQWTTGAKAVLTGVQTIDDYHGTGRQMVIFRVKSIEPPGKNFYSLTSTVYTGFRLGFTASISWADLALNANGYNIAAYQRGDEKVIEAGYTEQGYGSESSLTIFPNDESGQRVLYDVNGDGDVSEKNTLYSYTFVNPNVYTTVQQGITKAVRGNSSYYQRHDIVELDGAYRYRLRVTTSDGGVTGDLVIYDILENATNIDGHTGETGWKGGFVGVNTLSARIQGIDVKVYYSTASLSYNDTEGLKLTSGNWSLTPPADLSTVKAVAFDLATGLDGQPFKLINEGSVEVDIIMRAPDALQPSELAYNRPAYESTFLPMGSSVSQTASIIGNRVTIALRDLQDFEFIKHYETVNEETGEVEFLPLPGTEFKLYQCTNTTEGHTHTGTPGTSTSCWGTTAVRTVTSNDVGKVAFTDLDNGIYAIYETAARTGYSQMQYRYWVIEVDASKGTVSAPVAWRSNTSPSYPLIEMTWNEASNGGYYSLVNQRVKKNITITKAWTEDAARVIHPPQITLELYRNGVLYQTKALQTPSSSNASLTFSDLYAYDEYGRLYTYEVREAVPDGYTASPNPWTTESSGNSSATIRNTRLGVLDIKKLVAGQGGDTQKLFTFYVELKDSAGNPVHPLDGEGNPIPFTVRRIAADGTYTQEEAATDSAGVLTLQARHGETLRIIGLPVGASYAVTEKDESASKYIGVVSAGSATGVTSSTTNPSVTYTNTYKPDPAKVALPVQKTITGNATPVDKDFTFILAPVNGAPMPASGTLVITGSGSASFGDITYTAAGTYTYKIKETAGSQPGYTYDTAERTIAVTVVDNGGVLSAAWTVNGQSMSEIAFTNSYAPAPAKLALPVQKTISGNATPTNKAFTFMLTAVDGAPMPASETLVITGSGSASFGEITYAAAGSYTYMLKETDGNEPGYTYDNAEHTVVVTVVDNNGALSATWSVQGVTGSAIPFTNTYTPAGTMLALPVQKTVTGNVTPTSKDFTFTLAAVDGAPMPASETLIITGSGTASFGAITYTTAGTYTYKLRETAGSEPGYTYDPAERTVVVTVTDTNGVLSASWTVDGSSAAAIGFTNRYAPAETTLALPVQKTITGDATSVDKDFTFTITALVSAPLPASTTLVITGEDTASFGEITYTAAGVYFYTVRETAGDERGYSYDAAQHLIAVNVVDNNGVLSASWTLNGENADVIPFTNAYDHGMVQVTLPVKKNIIGHDRPLEKNFKFVIIPGVRGDLSYPMPESDTIWVTGGSAGSFAPIHFSKPGTYTYEIVEWNEPVEVGYLYDNSIARITITVEDIGGFLRATWTLNGEAATEIPFENIYIPEPFSLNVPVRKELYGQTPPTDAEFTFTIFGRTQTEPMPDEESIKITGEGIVAFGSMQFNEAGVYYYTIIEEQGDTPGYTYDGIAKDIRVVVEDEDGRLYGWLEHVDWNAQGEEVYFTFAEIVFYNEYQPAPTSITLPVKKAIAGNATPADKDFTFILTPVNGAPMPASDTLVITGADTASFGEIAYTAAGTYTYTIQEEAGSEPGYGYDAAQHTIVVTVTDTNGVLSATWTSDGEAVSEVAFTNTYAPDAATLALPIEKTMAGNATPADKIFRFTLAAHNGAPMPADAENDVSEVSIVGSGVSAFGVITYPTAGEYRYTVRETAGSEPGYAYDDTEYTAVVTVVDNNGVLSATWSAQGVTGPAMPFTNTYTPAGTTLTLPVHKTVTGNATPTDKEFTFMLVAVDGAPMPASNTLMITGSGTASFGAIAYTAAGTYTYKLRETAGNEPGYTYDPAERTVVVTVTDTDGVLSASWGVDGEIAVAVEFTNHYTPAETTVTLPVQKTITGNVTPTDTSFAFILTGIDSAPMPASDMLVITGAGNASFGAISYTAAGTYTYKIKETAGSEPGYTYDPVERTVVVTVTDTDGVLSASWTVDGETADRIGFTNRYTPAGTTIILPVQKTITGNATPVDKDFTFILAAVNGAPMPASDTLVITGADTASFGEIAYTAAGTYTYTVQEEAGSEPGYGYDAAQHTIVVTVTDTNGVLSATWTSDGEAVSEVTFTNPYAPDAATLALPIEKTMAGNATPADKLFRFTLAAHNGAPMPADAENGVSEISIVGSGVSAFGVITYPTAGEYRYTVRETAGSEPGYAYDDTEYTAVVTVVDNNGVLSATWSAQGVTGPAVPFTNTYTPAGTTLALPVQKTITGNETSGDKDFTFILAAVNGAPMPASDTLVITGAGTASFDEIPYTAAGTYTYKMTETAGSEPGYTYDPVECTVVVTVTDTNGVLGAAWTADGKAVEAIAFTNHYEPSPTAIELPVEKTIQYVTPPVDKDFIFTLVAVDGAPMPASDTLVISGANTASFGAITYTAAGAYTYKITEAAGTDTGYTYDASERTVVVTVIDTNGILSATWTVDDENAEAVHFTNNYQPLSTELVLPVRKALSGQVPPTDAEFTFKLAAIDGAPMPTEAEVRVTGTGGTAFGAIPYTATGSYLYTVTEQSGGAPGYTYDDTAYEVAVLVTDNNGQLEARWTADVEELLFTNDYTPAKTTVELPVEKVITGNATPADKDFTFTMAAVNGAPMPASDTLVITGAGSASFGAITYTHPGTYIYTVKEEAGSDPGYSYDPAKYIVMVTVVDQGGALSATWTMDGEAADAVLFTNNYTPSETTVSLPVRKAITGNQVPTNKDFTFILTAVDGAPMPAADTLTITGAGNASFGAITYAAAGTYTYKIQEEAGSEPGYGYDAAQHTVMVTVTDMNGALSATWTSDGEAVNAILFTNTYAPDAATLSLPIEKTVTGNATPTDKIFYFALTAISDAPMPADAENGVSKVSIVGSGASAFGVITYPAAGEYRYTVREIVGNDAGYTYDAREYEVLVTVTDENATLIASWTSDGGNALSFTNTYTPAKAALKLPVRKRIDGNPVRNAQFTFELAAQGNAPMPTGNGNTVRIAREGTGEFGEIEYAAVGTYLYTVREIADNDLGYTYDATAYEVTVTVTDVGGALNATWAATANGEGVREIVFTNPYVPVPAVIALGAIKTLKNKSLADGMFSFTLSDESGQILETVTNAASGNVTFSPILYTEPGVYTYTIAEKQGSLDRVTYDNAIHTVRVTVTDEGGVLIAIADKGPENVKFINTYRSDIPKTGYGADNVPYPYAIGMGALLALLLLALAGRKRKAAR